MCHSDFAPPNAMANRIVLDLPTMSFQKPEKDNFGDGPKIHKIRSTTLNCLQQSPALTMDAVTLTSRKVQALEKVSSELIERLVFSLYAIEHR